MKKIAMLSGLAIDINNTVISIMKLKAARSSLRESRNNLEQDALERRVQHRQRMFEVEREHERRMKLFDDEAAAQQKLQAAKMKVFDDAEAAREVMSSRIDTLMLKLHDSNVVDKEAVLLELHKVNNDMHELAMAALNA